MLYTTMSNACRISYGIVVTLGGHRCGIRRNIASKGWDPLGSLILMITQSRQLGNLCRIDNMHIGARNRIIALVVGNDGNNSWYNWEDALGAEAAGVRHMGSDRVDCA